jgi:hypothetical protein
MLHAIIGGKALRLRQRGTVATGAALARDPCCEVARLAKLRVPGQACRDVDDALITRLAHGGSLFATRFARHVI